MVIYRSRAGLDIKYPVTYIWSMDNGPFFYLAKVHVTYYIHERQHMIFLQCRIRSYTRKCSNSRVPLFLSRMNAFRTWSFPSYFCILWDPSSAKCGITQKVQAQQQPRVSIVSTGKGRSGLLMFDNSDPSKTIGLNAACSWHVHAQCACKRMNTVLQQT